MSERISAQIATPELFDKIVEEKYINKDKIKEKIEWYKKYCDLDKYTIKALEELLKGE